MEAGVIDMDTAAKIEAYAGEAHDALHDLLAGKSDMAPKARNDWFSAIPRDADPLDGLAQAGAITPEQAQAIRDYLEKLVSSRPGQAAGVKQSRPLPSGGARCNGRTAPFF